MTFAPLTAVPRYSAVDLARILGIPEPTAEQQEIIESPLGTAVVIAGAGSGKTTVIAQRVVYLVANRIVDAQSILGLTFTRKAVGELNSRIRSLLSMFRERTGEQISDFELSGLDVPTVSTYNSFAAAIVADHGVRAGIESDTRVLDIAEAMALAEEIVNAADHSEVPLDISRSALVDQILTLSAQINEHLQTPQEVMRYLDECLDAFLSGERFLGLLAAIRAKRSIDKEERADQTDRAVALAAAAGLGEFPGRRRNRDARADLIDLLMDLDIGKSTFGRLVTRRQVAVLAGAYLRLKRGRGSMEFSDQVAYAHRIMTAEPVVAQIERARWKVVMLDEYQDTSDSQFRLLEAAFGGLPVMAVGDPRQSIYGWRGASARNIEEFPLHFRAPDGSAARVLHLSTSWRNDVQVLEVANRIARGLPDADPETELSARPGAGTGKVTVSATYGHPDETYGSDQYAQLVSWMKGIGESDPSATRAVLCRKRGQFAPVARALTAAGLDVHIAGTTGMLDDPYVADVHSALHALVDPGAGDHLMRLLSGPTCGLGAADIAALDRFVRARNRRLHRQAADRRSAAETANVDDIGLVEGIDDLLIAGSHARARAAGLTVRAIRRIIRLAAALRILRRGITTVPALVRDAVRELDIDTEIEALSTDSAGLHRASLDAFVSLALDFAARHPESGPQAFLTRLAVLQRQDALAAPEALADPAAVTVMTIHASKGLEFDAVAIPDCVCQDLPSRPQGKHGWLGAGQLPYPLRGDHAKLPSLDLTAVHFGKLKELGDHLDEIVQPALDTHHEMEERRLAYVAVTRARAHLWMGAALYSTRTTANEFSPFLYEAIDVLGLPADTLPVPHETAQKPSAVLDAVPWPVQDIALLEKRRALIDRVQQRAAQPRDLAELAAHAAEPEVRAIAARAIALVEDTGEGTSDFQVPTRLSTTGIVSFLGDPQGFAERTMRPMPYPPNEASGLGTAFHAWVESYYGQATLGDIDVEQSERSLSPAARRRFATLRRTFEALGYAHLEPEAIELPFELVLEREDGTALHVPGTVDAVFRTPTGIRIVDWKTGSAPTPEVLQTMSVQLSVYALALSRLPQFASGTVDAEFCFLGSGTTVAVPRLLSAAELLAELEGGARMLHSQ